MFISKKAFNNLMTFLEDTRRVNEEMKVLVAEVKRDIAIQVAKRQAFQKMMESKWIKVTCPNCEQTIDVHTMQQSHNV